MNREIFLSTLTVGLLMCLQGCARDHDPYATTNVPLDTALKRARSQAALYLEGKTIGQIQAADHDREAIQYDKLQEKRHENWEAAYRQIGLNRDEIVEPRPSGITQ